MLNFRTIKFNFATRDREIIRIYYDIYGFLYIIECWITLSSDRISVDNQREKSMLNTIFKC